MLLYTWSFLNSCPHCVHFFITPHSFSFIWFLYVVTPPCAISLFMAGPFSVLSISLFFLILKLLCSELMRFLIWAHSYFDFLAHVFCAAELYLFDYTWHFHCSCMYRNYVVNVQQQKIRLILSTQCVMSLKLFSSYRFKRMWYLIWFLNSFNYSKWYCNHCRGFL